MNNSIDACPACGKGNENRAECDYIDPIWSGRGFFDNLKIRYCNHCGFGYTYPFLDENVIGTFYSKYYREVGGPFYFNFEYMRIPNYESGKLAELFLDRALAQLTLVRAFVAFGENDFFLDVGPGSGASFAVAKYIYPAPRLLAVELTDGAPAAYSRLYQANTGTSEQPPAPRPAYKLC